MDWGFSIFYTMAYTVSEEASSMTIKTLEMSDIELAFVLQLIVNYLDEKRRTGLVDTQHEEGLIDRLGAALNQ